MSLTLSAPVRVAAIVLGVVVLGGGYFVLGPGKPSTTQTQHRLIRHPHGLTSLAHKVKSTKAKGVPGEETAPAKKTQAAPAKHTASAKPAAKQTQTAPAAPAKPKAKPKPKPLLQLAPGLPDTLTAALRTHPVVVVAIENPKAPDDQLAEQEAAAGAALAGVGFVAVSVLDQDQIGPITRSMGVVDDPAVLIYQRPGTVIGKLHGYADRQTVAQAVQNAAPAVVAAPVRAPVTAPAVNWVDQVNAACRVRRAKQAKLSNEAQRIAQLPALLSEELAKLTAVHPPASAAPRYARLLVVLRTQVADARKLAVADRTQNATAATAAIAALNRDSATADALAKPFGFTACSG